MADNHITAEEARAETLQAMNATLTELRADLARRDEALYQAWTIIANAYVNASPGPETGWAAAPAEWRQAAERWRDEQFHPLIGATDEPTACPDSSLLAWGLHEVDPDHRWEA